MGFRDDFAARFREANQHRGPDIFPPHNQSRRTRPMGRGRARQRSESTSIRGWGYWFLLVAVAVIAYGCGGWTHATAIPEHRSAVPGEVPTDTVTVTVTKEVTVTKAVPQLPKDCADALQLATELAGSADPILNAGGKTSDILMQARIAITEKDHAKLNQLGSQLNDLDNKTSGATDRFLDLQKRLAGALQNCNHALGR